ncbi:hypothetical protein AVEN_3605-1 [Araneus ventricosus]|uniref:Uncharacterized protein n=1 Tax=Araneus ventricosus TaxID=182803 RepID=A0A4Y2FKF6_ARAVE|nr:hypothetical protein AVEN_3605-1 [Araneus ventricosus]
MSEPGASNSLPRTIRPFFGKISSPLLHPPKNRLLSSSEKPVLVITRKSSDFHHAADSSSRSNGQKLTSLTGLLELSTSGAGMRHLTTKMCERHSAIVHKGK